MWKPLSITIALGFLSSGVLSEPALADEEVVQPSIAIFEGSQIDLSRGWGEATACAEIEMKVECYRTEAEMDKQHPELVVDVSKSTLGAMSACSSAVRLYRSSGYAGGVLSLSTRQTTLNLSAYGFDNDTSSYVIGACDAEFYPLANLSGSKYPGSTTAYSSASSMLFGWENSISSVYIL